MNQSEFIKQYHTARQHTNSVKWDGLTAMFGREDLLPLWVADMDFKAPKAAVAAMEKVAQNGVFGYSLADDDYFAAYAKWQENRYHTTLKQDWFLFGLGVVNSLVNALLAFSDEGDAVLVQQPVYYPFMRAVEQNNRQLVVSPLRQVDGKYQMDLADVAAKFEEKNVRLMILCSPHNPVGRVWEEAELIELFELARKHHVLILCDEIHHDLLVNAHQFVSAISLNGGKYRDNVVVFDSPSKTFNLAALHHSHVIIPNPQLKAKFQQVVATLSQPQVDIFGQAAAKACYQHGDEWLDALLAVVKTNWQTLCQKLAEKLPKAKVADLQGTYLAWVDLSAYVDDDKLTSTIVNDAHLALDMGDWFGKGGAGFVRINLATTPEIVDQAIAALIAAIC